MKLLWNWRAVLRHAWSFRLLALSLVLSGAEVAYGVFATAPPADHLVAFAMLGFAITGAATVARFVAQKPLSGGADEQA